MPRPRSKGKKPVERGDFYERVEIQEGQCIGISEGEIPQGDGCLLQMTDSNNTIEFCAYLSDAQVRSLISGLRSFLRASK